MTDKTAAGFTENPKNDRRGGDGVLQRIVGLILGMALTITLTLTHVCVCLGTCALFMILSVYIKFIYIHRYTHQHTYRSIYIYIDMCVAQLSACSIKCCTMYITYVLL